MGARLHSDIVLGCCEFDSASDPALVRFPEEGQHARLRSFAACKAIVCLLYRTTFAVRSAFPAKRVSAFPPGADSQL